MMMKALNAGEGLPVEKTAVNVKSAAIGFRDISVEMYDENKCKG